MDPKPAPVTDDKQGGRIDTPTPAETPAKSGGMASEGGASGGGAGSPAEDAREGGMIGEG
jgi:hypothetical protein